MCWFGTFCIQIVGTTTLHSEKQKEERSVKGKRKRQPEGIEGTRTSKLTNYYP
jgi:hypothetical protein